MDGYDVLMAALKALERYAALRRELPQLIRDARDAGHTWEAIAAAASMSRAAVINASKRV